MICDLLHHCLFFTASRLSRAITRIAEDEFSPTGLSPTYAFLLLLVIENPGITQKELSAKLYLTPSTLTRFIDKLVAKGLVTRRTEGKNSRTFSTPRGEEIRPLIEQAWEGLYHKYSEALGYEEGKALAETIDQAGARLEYRS